MITLGLVANVDTSGVYVTMPGARGVLRGPYETLQNVTAGDKVLIVTTDDGESVIVGLAGASVPGVTIPDGSITSAKIANGTIVDEDVSASAAIAKTKISGTAITAADSGTVTSTMILNGTITNDDINASAAIARSKISGLPTSSTDNTLPRFDSTGGALQASSIVVDDNDRLRVASGSSGGLEIGSSGVLALSGTGGPSGISAPVGSTWRQTDANTSHGSLTGLLWFKVNTGTAEGTDWLVDYEGRWVTYTPSNANITIGTTGNENTGSYTLTGKTCHARTYVKLGTGGSFSGTANIGLPKTAVAHGWPLIFAGNVYFEDAGVAGYYGWVAITSGATRFTVPYGGASSTINNYIGTGALPFTWGAGDYVLATYTYEIGSY